MAHPSPSSAIDSADAAPPPAATAPLRLCIVQQVVPHYRVPLFDLLARQPGIRLSVWSDLKTPQGSLKPAAGTGAYHEVHAAFRRFGPAYWQPGMVRAAKACGPDQPDVLILPWNTRFVHLPLALRAARGRGVPTLLWGHGYSKDESPRRRRLRNRLLNTASGCIVYNRAAAERLSREGVARERVFVALNAIDQAPIRAAREHWVARPNDLAGFRQQHGMGRSSNPSSSHSKPCEVALFISRLEPDKRVDLLVRAFALVARQRQTAKLAIIGTGSEDAALRALVRSMGLEHSVIFAGGVYDDMNLAPWFLSSACMAYPVAIGLSILHAFGYGLPVVTSDDIASHNPEIEALRPGENGLLYRDGDITDLAAKILACMSDDIQRQRMGEQALATVQAPDGFCIERMVRGFTDAIRFALRTRLAQQGVR